MADELVGEWYATAQLTAKLAHDSHLTLIDVDVLAYERSALAVCAAMAIGGERADTTPQENALELLDIAMWGSHAARFAAFACPPPRPVPPIDGMDAGPPSIFRSDSFGGR